MKLLYCLLLITILQPILTVGDRDYYAVLGISKRATTKEIKKAYKKGVKIAFGTDAGVYPHGDNGKEFAFMVEAGMPEMEAIQSATITNAMLLQMENEIGQVKKGFFADIIAVNEDPTKNISTMENVVFVMKNGVIYKK